MKTFRLKVQERAAHTVHDSQCFVTVQSVSLLYGTDLAYTGNITVLVQSQLPTMKGPCKMFEV